MRTILIFMMCVLVTACADDSASYYINGANHALSVRRQQQYFWDDHATIALTVSRLPDCVRRHRLMLLPAPDVKLELFATAEQVWSLRQGTKIWQAETQTCNGLIVLDQPPAGGLGQPLGVFTVQNEKLIYQATPASTAPEVPDPG